MKLFKKCYVIPTSANAVTARTARNKATVNLIVSHRMSWVLFFNSNLIYYFSLTAIRHNIAVFRTKSVEYNEIPEDRSPAGFTWQPGLKEMITRHAMVWWWQKSAAKENVYKKKKRLRSNHFYLCVLTNTIVA